MVEIVIVPPGLKGRIVCASRRRDRESGKDNDGAKSSLELLAHGCDPFHRKVTTAQPDFILAQARKFIRASQTIDGCVQTFSRGLCDAMSLLPRSCDDHHTTGLRPVLR